MHDVIVVGVGAMGAAACFHLARRGARVLGIERHQIPHTRGSSHGYSRMIRMCYYEHPDYVPLLRRAYELWRELEAESGLKLLHVTGGLYMGLPGSRFVSGARQSAEQHGLAHEMFSRGRLDAMFPQFEVPDDYVALYEPSAGLLLPELVISTYAERALRHGAELLANERVVDWSSDGAVARVKTLSGEFRARRVVFCCGAWATALVNDLGVAVTPTRQVLGWVWPRRPELFDLGKLPVWAISNALGMGGEHYGFPLLPNCPGFKIAHHAPGPVLDPETDREPRPGDEETFRPVLRALIPQADGQLLSLRTCVYESSPDFHFIIDRHPRFDNAVVACGFSGHGFKFSSVVGEILADLVMEGSTRHPIGFLGLARFSTRAGQGLPTG